MLKSKIILFGGSFDPIHIGHLTVAAEALNHLKADNLIWIPAYCSPLKPKGPKAENQHRLKMIQLAIAQNEHFQVSECELNRPQPSYTLNTVQEFLQSNTIPTRLFWLAGADVIQELPHWYKVHELMDLCTLAIMYRAGYTKPDFSKISSWFNADEIKKLNENIIPVSEIDISSTEIRKRITYGEDVGFMLPESVYEYMEEQNLYKSV